MDAYTFVTQLLIGLAIFTAGVAIYFAACQDGLGKIPLLTDWMKARERIALADSEARKREAQARIAEANRYIERTS